MSAEPPPQPRRFLPWRSAAAGWVVAALALLVGVPLFLCMPPWNDVTLHDMAVRSILRGGVHYRDVFDTNLPGIDWAMTAVRAAFGWGYEVLRAFDLVVIAAEVWLLLGWVRRAGGTGYSVAWLAAAAALFYPFISEFNHVQRDPWLLLPALVAARMRLARVLSATENRAAARGLSFLEGFVWGAAVWVKPHVLFPAGAMWLVSAMLVARREPGRVVLRDLVGLVTGGLVAGAAGVAWLVGTGAWPYFLDVFLNWNPNYMSGVLAYTGSRFVWLFTYFRPWGMVHYAAIPLALLALREARAFSRTPGTSRRDWRSRWFYAAAESESAAAARALLAAMYLGWLAQGVVLQKEFDYVYVPIVLLAMAVIATHRWAVGFAYLVWFLLVGVLWNFTTLVPKQYPGPGLPVIRLEQAPFTDPNVLKLWPRCWREGGTPELRNRTGQYIDIHCGTNWVELNDVARFLTEKIDPPLGPRELNCWHDSTHPLYLMLDLEPATRYMHYGTALRIRSEGDWIKKRITEEVASSPQRYVVSDLLRMTHDFDRVYKSRAGEHPHRLPGWFPLSQRDTFPWDQPIVYRSGRYLVHKVTKPVRDITIPDWEKVDELGPGEDLK